METKQLTTTAKLHFVSNLLLNRSIDLATKMQLLEQEKHRLKRKLDQLDGEYENRLIELQTDCNILKNQLDDQQQLAKQTEKVSLQHHYL